MSVGVALALGVLVIASTSPTDSGWLAVGAAAMLAADITGGIAWGWSARRRRGLERGAFVCVTAIFFVWEFAAVAWLASLRHQGDIESILIVQAGYVAAALCALASGDSVDRSREIESEKRGVSRLLESADAALYSAKKAGGDCVVLATQPKEDRGADPRRTVPLRG